MFVYPEVPVHVVKAIRSATVAIVVGHVNPDGDCIHSQIAAQKLLQQLGTEVHLVNAGPFSRKEIKRFEPLFAPHVDIQLKERNPLVLMVDCSTLDRIGYIADEIEGLSILTVDHHSSGTHVSDLSYIVPKSFSTSLNIMQLYKALDVEITLEIADHIFFGLATDTGFLKFIGSFRGETFRLMAELVDLGVSPNDIFDRMEGGNTLESQQFLAKLILGATSLVDGRLMIATETKEDLETYGATNRPSDSLYAHLLGVDDVEVVLYFKIVNQKTWEVGFRASHSSTVDVGAIASKFGGGGHRRAAGATIEDSYESTKEKLVTIISQSIDS